MAPRSRPQTTRYWPRALATPIPPRAVSESAKAKTPAGAAQGPRGAMIAHSIRGLLHRFALVAADRVALRLEVPTRIAFLQEQPECQGVRDEETGHDHHRNEERGSQHSRMILADRTPRSAGIRRSTRHRRGGTRRQRPCHRSFGRRRAIQRQAASNSVRQRLALQLHQGRGGYPPRSATKNYSSNSMICGSMFVASVPTTTISLSLTR